jgi:hypothetical protein
MNSQIEPRFKLKLLPILGFRHWTYRKRAAEALCLKRGDTVVDLGC